MVATIYKVKYFPNLSILEAPLEKTFFCLASYVHCKRSGGRWDDLKSGRWEKYQNMGGLLVTYPFLLYSPIYMVFIACRSLSL